MLTQGQINEIEAQTEGLLSAAFGDVDDAPIPINLDPVLDALALELRAGKFQDPSISGYFVKSDRRIYVSAEEPPERQAFTVGHEIGHFVRHTDKDRETFHRRDQYNLGADQVEEAEANWFAASLLMPREQVKRYWNLYQNVGLMARAFAVSRIAMQWRLKNLGMIG
jgi:Zn-dependent peptidase ImmA (M78 family)